AGRFVTPASCCAGTSRPVPRGADGVGTPVEAGGAACADDSAATAVATGAAGPDADAVIGWVTTGETSGVAPAGGGDGSGGTGARGGGRVGGAGGNRRPGLGRGVPRWGGAGRGRPRPGGWARGSGARGRAPPPRPYPPALPPTILQRGRSRERADTRAGPRR